MKIAVLIPCLNEAAAISDVVRGFREILPNADVYVYDNGSDDDTARLASSVGAIVKNEPIRGKGVVIQRMFREITADVYIMVDGDNTYSPEDAPKLLALISNGTDMAVGSRLKGTGHVYRAFHGFGNRLITYTLNTLFGCHLTDVLSGYRAFTKEFIKSVPVISNGFEVETELTLNALDSNFLISEVPIQYRPREAESSSKLKTFRDGFRIISTIIRIFRDYRPLHCLGTASLICFLGGLIVGFPVINEFYNTGYVARVPSAILAAALETLSFVFLGVGLILDTLCRFRKQNHVLLRRFLR